MNHVIEFSLYVAGMFVAFLGAHFVISVVVMAALCAVAYRGALHPGLAGDVECSIAMLGVIGLFITLAPHETNWYKLASWLVMVLYCFAMMVVERDRNEDLK